MFNFLFFFLLIYLVSGDDEVIVQCAKDALKSGGNEIKKRPTIDPSNCLDLDAGSCTAIFALAMANNHVTNRNNNP